MTYKKWVFSAILLFVIGIASGLMMPSNLISEQIAILGDFSAALTSLPPILVAVFIFAKNVSVLLFSFALSPVFCLIPILALGLNGYMIAAIGATITEQKSLGFVLAALLPHGILELPALILGEAAALSFGTVAVISLFRKESRNQLLPNFRQNLKYLMVALGLLLPAAIIETFVTPLLLS